METIIVIFMLSAVIVVTEMRENMETMLPAFPFKDDKERKVSIERSLIVYEMGIKDGINEWLKTNKGI